jgi:hypothetical protein
MHRIPALGAVFAAACIVAGCSFLGNTPSATVGPSAVAGTTAPGATSELLPTNCPTLPEARAAVPNLVNGPNADAVPIRTIILQCTYTMPEVDAHGDPAEILILVYDASVDGTHFWDLPRDDPGFPNPTDIPGLAQVAFATGASGQYELWVVQGRYGFHVGQSRIGGVPLDQMVAMARAMLVGLAR